MKININELKHTKQLAEKIADKVEIGDVIELSGDLGAGKTTFAQFFINSLLIEQEEVLSPTFNIVHPYSAKEFTIWHFDLYRLDTLNEVEEIGIYEAFDEGVSLIEWPQIISSIVPENRLLIDLTMSNNSRYAEIKAFGTWESKLTKIL